MSEEVPSGRRKLALTKRTAPLPAAAAAAPAAAAPAAASASDAAPPPPAAAAAAGEAAAAAANEGTDLKAKFGAKKKKKPTE